MLAMFDMVATPYGARFVYTLPKGFPVWTYDVKTGIYMTVPWEAKLGQVLQPSAFKRLSVVGKIGRYVPDIHAKYKVKDNALTLSETGSECGWSFEIHRRAKVITAAGQHTARRLRVGSKLIVIPHAALYANFVSEKFTPPDTHAEYLTMWEEAYKKDFKKVVKENKQHVYKGSPFVELYGTGTVMLGPAVVATARSSTLDVPRQMLDVDFPVVSNGLIILE